MASYKFVTLLCKYFISAKQTESTRLQAQGMRHVEAIGLLNEKPIRIHSRPV